MHFVKHSLILAMLAVLTGCGGGSSSSAPPVAPTPEVPDDATVISSITPDSAVVGVKTDFVMKGQKLSSGLQVNLPNCQNISPLSGTTTAVTFSCTPQAVGTQTLTVKTATGMTVFTTELKFQATAPVDTIVVTDIIVPSELVTGKLTSFTVKGQNLTNTLQIGISQCTNLTQNSVTPTQIVFTCTPQTAGNQTLEILNNGVSISKRVLTFRDPPPALIGSWRQTAANGCTGTIEGETIVGARSQEPIFTFVRASDTDPKVRLIGNDGFSYTSANCSGTETVTTGVTKIAALYENVGLVQQINDISYYPVNTTYTRNSSVTPDASAIVFKDSNTFCLFNGIVTPTNIMQFAQSVDLTRLGCFARNDNSKKMPFSQKAPLFLGSTSANELLPRVEGELLLNVIERLNQRGQSGYALILDAKTIRANFTGNALQTYDLVSQISTLPGVDFTYQQKDDPASANPTEARLAQLNELGAQGWMFLGKKQLDTFFGARNTYVKTNIPQQFVYQNDPDINLNTTNLVDRLNQQGALGCRFLEIRPQSLSTNTYRTLCVNSSRHSGTFGYRLLPFPASSRADALQSLLDTQQKDGYYPIRVVQVDSSAAPEVLFERNSVISFGIQSMQFKVFSQSLPDNQAELISFLNDQGKLGWHLWSPIKHPSGDLSATIFASSPFSNILDGEPVDLSP
jgi:hypothetical protein